MEQPPRDEPVSLQLIASKLDRLVWRKRPWGVDERQVWHVVQRMDEMYRQLYREQQVRYEALLAQAKGLPVEPGTSVPTAPRSARVSQPAMAPQPVPQAVPTRTVSQSQAGQNPYVAQQNPYMPMSYAEAPRPTKRGARFRTR